MMLKQGRACLTFKRTIFLFNFYSEKLKLEDVAEFGSAS
jgi:hypothetical protein